MRLTLYNGQAKRVRLVVLLFFVIYRTKQLSNNYNTGIKKLPMKKITTILVIALVIILVLPRFYAHLISNYLDVLVKKFDSTPGYQVSISNRTSSWFTSSAVIKVAVDISLLRPTNANTQYSVNLKHLSADVLLNIQHGPILLGDALSLGLAAWTIEIDNSFLRKELTYTKAQSLYSVDGTTGFYGGSEFTDRVSAFSTTGRTQINFSGWLGQGSLSSHDSYYTGIADKINFISDTKMNITTIVLEIKADSDSLTVARNPLYNATAKFSIGSVTVNPVDTISIELDQLVISAQTKVNDSDSLMNVNLDYTIDKVESRDILVNDFFLNLQINNLVTEFLDPRHSTMQYPRESAENLQNIIQNNVLAQLKASPEITIKELSVNINSHSFSGSLSTKIHDVVALPLRLDDPNFWLSHMTLHSDLKVDKALVSLIGELILLPRLGHNSNVSKLSMRERKVMVASQMSGIIYALIAQGVLLENTSNYEGVLMIDKGIIMPNEGTKAFPF